MEKRLLNPNELADLLGVPLSWVYDRTRLGQTAIPHIKLGKYVRFDADAVLKFFQDKPLLGNRLSCMFVSW